MPKRRKSMRGGDLSSSLSGWGDSFNNLFSSKPKPTSYATPVGATSYTTPVAAPSYAPTGGKRRRNKSKKYGGSVTPYTSTSNVAFRAASFTGGKTRRRKHRHSNSCRHTKSRRR